MKILICGFGRAGIECFYQLISNYNINSKDLLVFTHDTFENEAFVKHLEANNVRFTYNNINKSLQLVKEFSPEFLLSIYYRYKVSKDILNLVNYKAINLHPSLLPAYKGTKSCVWMILNKEIFAGVSFHYMDDDIDTGRIILQKRIKISEEDTSYSLYHKLISLFSTSFCEAFNLLLSGYNGKKQTGYSSYFPRKLPYQGELNIKDLTFEDGWRFIRAMHFPPHKGAIFKLKDGSKVNINSIESLKYYMGL